MQTTNPLFNIFILSLIAGLGTSIGGLIVVIRKPGKHTYGFLMGITAGVMICLSFLELVNEAWELAGFETATLGFAAGAFFMYFLDLFAPHMRFGEREIRNGQDKESFRLNSPRLITWARQKMLGLRERTHITDRRLLKTGLLLAIGITIHNIPEGIAVGAGYAFEPKFGMFIAIAILLHNIPEGIATALPLITSGVNKWDAFRVATLSGLSEPVGALLAGFFLSTFIKLIPFALAFAGGVMIFITLDELIPAAREFGHHHTTALGIILGSIFVFVLSGLFGV
ncbi:MAG: ZIP family metal transporter [Anaerolineaceae bacterium]